MGDYSLCLFIVKINSFFPFFWQQQYFLFYFYFLSAAWTIFCNIFLSPENYLYSYNYFYPIFCGRPQNSKEISDILAFEYQNFLKISFAYLNLRIFDTFQKFWYISEIFFFFATWTFFWTTILHLESYLYNSNYLFLIDLKIREK